MLGDDQKVAELFSNLGNERVVLDALVSDAGVINLINVPRGQRILVNVDFDHGGVIGHQVAQLLGGHLVHVSVLQIQLLHLRLLLLTALFQFVLQAVQKTFNVALVQKHVVRDVEEAEASQAEAVLSKDRLAVHYWRLFSPLGDRACLELVVRHVQPLQRVVLSKPLQETRCRTFTEVALAKN